MYFSFTGNNAFIKRVNNKRKQPYRKETKIFVNYMFVYDDYHVLFQKDQYFQ